MNIEQLIQIAREYLDDEAGKKVWSEAFMFRSFIEAERQACNRTNFLYEDSDAEYTQIKLKDSVSTYDISTLLTYIEWIGIDGTQITHKSKAELDRTTPAWRTETGIKNKTVCCTIRGRKLRVVPIPDASLDATYIQDTEPTSGMSANDTWYDGTDLYLYNGTAWVSSPNATLATLNMEVYRLPEVDLTSITNSYEPEIPEEYHHPLVYWVLHEAYKHQDKDTYDQERSDYYLNRFVDVFGPYVPSDVRINQFQEDRVLTARPIAYMPKLSRTTSDIDEAW